MSIGKMVMLHHCCSIFTMDVLVFILHTPIQEKTPQKVLQRGGYQWEKTQHILRYDEMETTI